MERLGTLYHWSPSDRRKSIETMGLVPGSPATVASGELPYVCVGPTPGRSWTISGDMDWVTDVDSWDLWEIVIPDDAKLHVLVRATFGPHIEEIKLYTTLPPHWLWYVGTRQPLPTVKP